MRRFGRSESRVVFAVVATLFWAVRLCAGPVDPAQVQKVTDAFLKAKTGRPEGKAGRDLGAGIRRRGRNWRRGAIARFAATTGRCWPTSPTWRRAGSSRWRPIPISPRSSRIPSRVPSPDGTDPKNPLYRMVREDLRLRAKALAEHPELKSPRPAGCGTSTPPDKSAQSGDGTFQQWPPVGSTATGGWVETAWEQGEPYNQFCPLDTVDGGRSYRGLRGDGRWRRS